jgi:hypothetical protein
MGDVSSGLAQWCVGRSATLERRKERSKCPKVRTYHSTLKTELRCVSEETLRGGSARQ